LIVPVSQFKAKQLMPSQSRSHVEYLIQTNRRTILVAYSFYTQNDEKYSFADGLGYNTI